MVKPLLSAQFYEFSFSSLRSARALPHTKTAVGALDEFEGKSNSQLPPVVLC